MEPKSIHRNLTATFSTDVAVYCRLMQDDEAAKVVALETYSLETVHRFTPFRPLLYEKLYAHLMIRLMGLLNGPNG